MGDLSEESLHLVEPAAVGRNKVQMPARMPGDPKPDLGGFVRRIIVQDRVDFQVLGRGGFQLPQERQKFFLTMAFLAAGIHRAGGHVQRGEK